MIYSRGSRFIQNSSVMDERLLVESQVQPEYDVVKCRRPQSAEPPGGGCLLDPFGMRQNQSHRNVKTWSQ